MNWLRILVVMVAMVGLPAISTVMPDSKAVQVASVDIQDTIVDLSASDCSVLADNFDDDTHAFLPRLSASLEATIFQASFFYHRVVVEPFTLHHTIRGPPSLS